MTHQDDTLDHAADPSDDTDGLAVAMLRGAGLGDIDPSIARPLMDLLTSELELRVGVRLVESLSEEQVDRMERLIDSGDHSAARKWLGIVAPNHPAVVRSEMARLEEHLRARADEIRVALIGGAR